MKIILTLHTSTEWDLAGRIKGWTDIGLSSQGQTEAQELAKSLVDLGIDFIACSDLKRASQTAEIINTLLKVPLQLNKGLCECSFGKIEGLTIEQVIKQYGQSTVENFNGRYEAYDFRPFGGENRNDVFTRHIEVIKSISKNNPDKTLLIVGHELGIFTLLKGLGYESDLKHGEYKIIEYN
jgi:broad specificity phosphatase PhoE